MLNRDKHVLIVAGGDGVRMGSEIPKQFCQIAGKPILFHAFNSFLHISNIKFTLVISRDQLDYWNNLCRSTGFNIPHNIAFGGSTRFHSVARGLANIPSGSLVLIHDAVRPFVAKDTINNVMLLASRAGNAVPAINLNDSIRKIDGAINRVIDRAKLKALQTPQGFHSEIIKSAYNQPYDVSFTDDASVLESIGVEINLVEGNPENIKITNPVDFIIAEGLHKYVADITDL